MSLITTSKALHSAQLHKRLIAFPCFEELCVKVSAPDVSSLADILQRLIEELANKTSDTLVESVLL